MKGIQKSGFILVAFLFITGALFFINGIALAKGPFDKVTVRGGLIENEVEVSDPLLMDFFDLSNFPNARIEQPQVEGEGYLVTRYFKEADGSFTAWDQLRFYPNQEATGGTIYYEGLVNGSSEYDGKWYLASFSGSTRMRQIIQAAEHPLPFVRTLLTHFLYSAAALAGLALIVVTGLKVLSPTINQSSSG